MNSMKLIPKVKGRECLDRNENCLNWFHVISSVQLLTSHQKTTRELAKRTINKNKVNFENYAARWFSPIGVYLDLESLVVPF